MLSGVTMEVIGTYDTGIFDGSASEVLAFDEGSDRLFVANAEHNAIDVFDISDPTVPTPVTAIDLSPFGAAPTSVEVHDGLVAVATFPEVVTAPGTVSFFDVDGCFSRRFPSGRIPTR